MSDDRHDRQPHPPRDARGEDDRVPGRDDERPADGAGAAAPTGPGVLSTNASQDDPAASGADAAESASPGREVLDALAGQLVWRIGRTSDDAPLTVRVGLAGSAPAFAELPRLRNASDAEVQGALDAGEVRVEWVGPRGR